MDDKLQEARRHVEALLGVAYEDDHGVYWCGGCGFGSANIDDIEHEAPCPVAAAERWLEETREK